MFYKLLPLLITALWGVMALPVASRANANTPLFRAVIQDIYNFVQLMPRKKPKRKARRADAMTPGDGLSTGRSSLAELLFNDGSLARVGERAVFNFLPKTRNFRLNNGTILLLIPPGRGQTNIVTPNATAAIQGSALFVRYDKNTKITLVGALTNSGIEVFNKDASKKQVLKAGQMTVLRNGFFRGLYDFDLRTFYRTSDLVKDLELDKPNSVVVPDPALASVREETVAAIKAQPVVEGQGVIDNPPFVALTDEKTDEKISDSQKANNDEESNEDSSIITTTTNNDNRVLDLLEASEAASDFLNNDVESNSLPTNQSTQPEQPSNQDPGNQDPGNQQPGNQDPGNQDPGNQDPGNQDPGNQGQDNQGQGNQGQDNQGQDNQGQDNQGQGNQQQDNQQPDNQPPPST